MVQHGRTGYLASDMNEFAYYGGHLAMNEEHRLAMAREARSQLVDELANSRRIWNAWQRLFAAMERVGSGKESAEENGKGKLKLPPCECEARCDSIRNQCGR